jgi:predicted ATPase
VALLAGSPGIDRLTQTGHRIWISYLKALQAEGLALTGDLEGAWSLIEDSVAQIEAGEERSHYAEVLRLSGWILHLRGEPDQAMSTFRKALAMACNQQAKSWELRAATTLARLLVGYGDKAEALALLAPVYDWFSEGRDTKDLKEAGQLLFELCGVPRSLNPDALELRDLIIIAMTSGETPHLDEASLQVNCPT